VATQGLRTPGFASGRSEGRGANALLAGTNAVGGWGAHGMAGCDGGIDPIDPKGAIVPVFER